MMPPGLRGLLAAAGMAIAVGLGVVLRFVTTSDLWLDEALTVNIASLPLSDLTDALRHDGAPPLYYLVLNGWSRAFGEGDVAVRSLSGVFSVAALPLAWAAGRRLGGQRVGWAAVVLLATSPFAIRYATEARMYSLVTLLALAGWIAVRRAMERPAIGRLAAVAAVSGSLMLTHYWAFYLLAATGLLVARKRHWRVVAAIAAGGVAFVPWLPHFLYQAAHTGTPWGEPGNPIQVPITTVVDFGGGPWPEARVVSAVLVVLWTLALTGRAIDRRHIQLDLRTLPAVRAEAAVVGLTLAIAMTIAYATDSAFATRYTAIVFPIALLAAAFGVTAFADRRIAGTILAVAAVAGLVGGLRNAATNRTQAAEVVAAIRAHGGVAGDVVVYCPDQVAPDVDRLLPAGFRQLTFPDGAGPRFVDWVDYRRRVRSVSAEDFASRVLDDAPGRTIWHVWTPGYRTLGRKCEQVNDAFAAARPGARTVVESDDDVFERHNLTVHPSR